MTTPRRKAARIAIAMLLGVMIVLPIAFAFHTVDVRNSRRDLNQSKIETLDALTRANLRRDADNRETLRHICEVQNRDAHALNAVIDYFERVAKAQYPSPNTDKFWNAVPRPVVHRCTPPPQPAFTVPTPSTSAR